MTPSATLAVLLAALGVFGTGTGWPDVIVAAIMGGLGLWGGWQIVRQARGELFHSAMPASVERIDRCPGRMSLPGFTISRVVSGGIPATTLRPEPQNDAWMKVVTGAGY